MTTIRIGGVPEHFNLPIHLGIENGTFADSQLDIKWTTFDGGTGQMCKALRDDQIDVCILLTEGIIKDIINGNPSKIISVYVNTPLIWGIHTGSQNKINNHNDIYTHSYAISRFGSGSHLMAIVDANSQGKTLDDEQFKVIGNLDGALQSLTMGETDVFYWEKFTTKPFVDSGQLRRIGEFITPWPCFVIAARASFIQDYPRELSRLLRRIHDQADAFMNEDGTIDLVSQRYHILKEDAARWYHSTEWATHGWVSDKMVKSVIYNLAAAGIIPPDTAIPEIIWKRE